MLGQYIDQHFLELQSTYLGSHSNKDMFGIKTQWNEQVEEHDVWWEEFYRGDEETSSVARRLTKQVIKFNEFGDFLSQVHNVQGTSDILR